MTDFRAENHGTIWLLYPLSEAAEAWVVAHIGEHYGWGKAIVVEHRYIEDIIVGARGDGLEVEVDVVVRP